MGPKPQDAPPAEDAGGDEPSLESISFTTLMLLLIIILVLFLWYRSISKRIDEEKEDQINHLNADIERNRTELEKLKEELENEKRVKDVTLYKDLMEAIDVNLKQLSREIKKALYGDNYEEVKDMADPELKAKLDDTLAENKRLEEDIEAMRLSVVMPETQHIVDQYGTKDVTPEKVVRHLLNELEETRIINLRLHKENKDNTATADCMKNQLKIKESTIVELEKQVACGEKLKQANKMLEQQIENDKGEIRALQQSNEEKLAALNEMAEEIRRKDEMIKRLYSTLSEELSTNQIVITSLKRDLEAKNMIIRDFMTQAERKEELLKSLLSEISMGDLSEVRQLLTEKLCELQSFNRCMRHKIQEAHKSSPEPGFKSDYC